VSVTDAENTTKTRDWTIAVNTSNYVFIDPNASAGGAGTLADPLSSFSELYTTSKTDSTWSGYHVILRDGSQSGGATVYPWDYDAGVLEDDAVTGKKIVYTNDKPVVFMAYPGESPEIDLKHYWQIFGVDDNLWDGITFDLANNPRALGLQPINGNRMTIANCTFKNNDNTTGASNNYSYIFTTRVIGTFPKYHCLQDNTATGGSGVNNGYWCILYTAENVLIENNTITSCGIHNIGPKESIRYMTIRQNRSDNAGEETVDYQYSDGTSAELSGHAEICYNLCMAGACDINGNAESVGHPVYVFRNTLYEPTTDGFGSAKQSHAGGTSGPFSWDKNVIINQINEVTYEDRIWYSSNNDTLTYGDNLVGAPADGIVDGGTGLLTGANRTTYLGTHGHEIP
jgi:hypothetical protein